MSKLQHIFVYGTLKRGQCRESAWPRPPVLVQPARVSGELYDLGAYPAMLSGSDWVVGEVWSFEYEDVEPTLRVLDEIEDYRRQPDDLYRRVEIACWLGSGAQLRALTYIYAQPQHLSKQLRVTPDAGGNSVWPPVPPEI